MAQGIGIGLITGLVLAFVGLGMRVLQRAPKEGGAPDRWIALFFASQGSSYGTYLFTGEMRAVMLGVLVAIATFSLLEFTRLVFRPESRIARALSIVATIAIGAAFLFPAWTGADSTGTRLIAAALRCAGYTWPVIECALYYGAMKRRMNLGLAQPVVANRFLLWSIWTAGAVAVPLGGVVVRTIALMNSGVDPTIGRQLNPTTLGLVAWVAIWMVAAAVALWLSFFPPQRYVAFLNERAARRGTPTSGMSGGAAGATA